ncbi:potassium transporter Kup [Kribbella capetownensis]|uniref:Probable potassium transport system protein Kup n=1 Tax=Kribbella capetownensis TaxID=1572659 RepID=A0A4R0IUY1_9ACTN|nr:KUP/HAK/KT family potassium transporter [Kribbella capetownensis]TCC35278.1 potassium transporter Kup [Kribbella capetownensis]
MLDKGNRFRPAGVGVILGVVGVVFGDIGTSPLYAVQTVFSIGGGAVAPTAGDVFGIVSLIFWSITLIVSVKYVVFVMRADNDGEGGVMALAAFLGGQLGGIGRRGVALILGLGILGAALFFGDSIITPAISVLSAVEGLEVASLGLSHLVLPVTAVVLTLLFAMQRRGTERIGNLFGPVMTVWFVSIGAAGVAGIVPYPGVLWALSPTYAVAFVVDRPSTAFVAMGAVVLAITGAEALYADMGHFGRNPIRRAWFVIVFPALTLNYLAQGALILHDPGTRENPFFLLLPAWARLPMVLLATAATVIASQAVISGAFSVSRQALGLGLLPRLRIRQTSGREYGQIYIPGVNWLLFAAVLIVVLTFGSSARLATAYGVAVTGTFLITTTMFLVVARTRWHWATWQCVLVGLVLGGLELSYFAANLTKVTHGGWLTLLIAAVVFTVMVTWRRGHQIVSSRRAKLEGPLPDFIGEMRAAHLKRVPGLAVFPHADKATTPLALRLNVAHNHVRHERIVIISSLTAPVPHVPWDRRLSVDQLRDPNDGIVYVAARFGFHDDTDLPEVVRRVAGTGPETDFDPDAASYFVSRLALRRTRAPGLAGWRKQLFLVLWRNGATQPEFFHLPDDRTVILSTEVRL